MTSVKPLDGGKHAGRSNRDLTLFQWFAAMLISNAAKPTLGLEGDSLIDVANNSHDFEGVIDYPGNAPGRHTTITTAGRTKLKMSGTGKAGDSIKVIEGGKGAKANADEAAIGNALADWVDGEIAPFIIDKHIAKANASALESLPLTPLTTEAGINNASALESLPLTPLTTEAGINVAAQSALPSFSFTVGEGKTFLVYSDRLNDPYSLQYDIYRNNVKVGSMSMAEAAGGVKATLTEPGNYVLTPAPLADGTTPATAFGGGFVVQASATDTATPPEYVPPVTPQVIPEWDGAL